MRLLSLSVILVAVCTPAAYFWYNHQLASVADALLLRAEQSEQANQWSKAASYYQRFLQLRPANTEALVRMVEAYAKEESTPRRRARISRLLYQVCGRAPQRTDLRLMLAENLLKTADFDEAQHEAEKLIAANAVEAPAARRVVALAMISQARPADSESVVAAIDALKAAFDETPGDIDLAVTLANALRERSADELDADKASTYADQVMDRLVAAKPKDADSLLARYQYRRRNSLPDAAGDLQLALEIVPDHVEALLLSAEAAFEKSGAGEEAEQFLRRAVAAAPQDDPRPALVLARILTLSGKHSDASEVLREARLRITGNVELDLTLAESLSASADLREATEVLDEVQKQSDAWLAQLSNSAQILFKNRIRLLRSRLALANKNSHEAVPELIAILNSAKANALVKQTPPWLHATTILAQHAGQLGHWDRAASYWDDLCSVAPQQAGLAKSAVAAYLQAGDPSAAIRRLDDYARHAEPDGELSVQQVQAHLAIQLSRPKSAHDWTEFLRVLEHAKTKVAGRWELVLAEVQYLFANEIADVANPTDVEGAPVKSDKRQRILALLADAEQSFAEEAAFWEAAVGAYQRMGRDGDVSRALSRYLETETSLTKRIRLQAALLANQGRFDEADAFLLNARRSLTGEEQRQIDRLRIETFVAGNKREAAQKLTSSLLEFEPNDAQVLILGIKISLDLEDWNTAKKWETALGGIEGAKWDWQFLRAVRLLASFELLSRAEKMELAGSILSLRGQRPRWYPVLALAGRHAQLSGEKLQALSDFKLAVRLGDRRVSTLQQLVSLLYELNRLSEAQDYLAQLSSEDAGNALIDSLAIQLAVKEDRLVDALELAEKGVARHPNNVMRRIWLANLLLRNDQSREAMKTMRDATIAFPDDLRVWNGLLTLFVNEGRAQEARETLVAILEEESLSAASRHFVAAHGFEVLGELSEARRHYESALELAPDNVDVRLRFARLLLAQDQGAASKHLEHVLRVDPRNRDARRELARLLAISGRDADWDRAQRLLKRQSDEGETEAAANDQLRALLLSRQGRSRVERLRNCRAAEDILVRLIRNGSEVTRDADRQILAGIYEQQAAFGAGHEALLAARAQLRFLVDRQSPSPEHLTVYIDFLMRHATANSASHTTVDETTTKRKQEDDLRELFLTDAESRIRDLRRAQETSQQSFANALSNVEMTVRLLQARGRHDEAGALVAQFANRHADGDQDEETIAQILYATGNLYSTLGKHAEAEQWYRRLMKLAPRAYLLVVQSLVEQDKRNDAAELCLSIADGQPTAEQAVVLAHILTSHDGETEVLPAVRAAIEAAVSTHSDNVELLQATAVMKASQGDYDGAVRAFRRIVQVEPGNALAMNNLATVLAEHPAQRVEALEMIERAINLAGRKAALLDTQGTILLKLGNYGEAIACLEEATASGASDARYHFHLAVAYQRASRIDDAIATLQIARDLGLEDMLLTNDDRTLLVRLEKAIAPTATVAGGAS